ncbi:site-specific integrase [Streptomyces sp. NPDC001508]|uniref:site-specific integrase n=1 Tax=Streptomyces sp. NPDC001508 TaxID=3154656 RepID=UPI00332A6015
MASNEEPQQQGWRLDPIPSQKTYRDDDGFIRVPMWIARDGKHVADTEIILLPSEAAFLSEHLTEALAGSLSIMQELFHCHALAEGEHGRRTAALPRPFYGHDDSRQRLHGLCRCPDVREHLRGRSAPAVRFDTGPNLVLKTERLPFYLRGRRPFRDPYHVLDGPANQSEGGRQDLFRDRLGALGGSRTDCNSESAIQQRHIKARDEEEPGRLVPLPPNVAFELPRHIKNHGVWGPERLLFPNVTRTGYLYASYFYPKIWMEALGKGQVKYCKAHSLRHYYGSRLLYAGVPENDVADWMGHSSTDVLREHYHYIFEGAEQRGRAAIATMLTPGADDPTEASEVA